MLYIYHSRHQNILSRTEKRSPFKKGEMESTPPLMTEKEPAFARRLRYFYYHCSLLYSQIVLYDPIASCFSLLQQEHLRPAQGHAVHAERFHRFSSPRVAAREQYADLGCLGCLVIRGACILQSRQRGLDAVHLAWDDIPSRHFHQMVVLHCPDGA